MVEVFKTDVKRRSQARSLITLLSKYFPESRINFDLEDCDKILRIQGSNFCPHKIMQIVAEKGFMIKLFD